MSPRSQHSDITRLGATELGGGGTPERLRLGFPVSSRASFIQLPPPPPAWELNRGVCVHTRACVCFTKYSFVSLVTPEDHANVFSTSCHCSSLPPSSLFYFFLNENGISPIPPFRKYSPAPVNITSPPPPLCPFFSHASTDISRARKRSQHPFVVA